MSIDTIKTRPTGRATPLLRQAPTATVGGERTCGCGQALDCCHHAHCPRCGVTLRLTLGAA